MTEITQKAFLKGSRRFELADDEDAIRCEYRKGRNLYRFKVELAQLNPSGLEDRHFATSMLVGTLIFGLATIGMLTGIVFSKPWSDGRIIFTLFGILFLLITMMCAFGIACQNYRVFVFPNQASMGESVVFFSDKPDEDQFNRFIEELKERIAKAKLKQPQAKAGIASEIRELLKLKDEGVLTEEEFQKAKARLIGGQSA